ncbi:hypothetical protein Avbf_04624 [Armadillidium vulgare]|nr:hypothetical protein Avbf_04624 [Armadillidium vulgare]
MYNLLIHYADGLPSYVKLLFIDFGIQLIGFVLTSVLRTEKLGLFLFTRILKTGKDRRFDKIKESTLHLFIVWILQGVWVIVTLAKSYSSTINQTRKNWMEGIHWLGFDKFITTGLWSLSRHPNYFGEILLWFGLYVSASSVFRSYEYLTVFSPVFVYLLITQLSGIPPLEKYGQKKWGKQPSYREYINKTPLLIPFL